MSVKAQGKWKTKVSSFIRLQGLSNLATTSSMQKSIGDGSTSTLDQAVYRRFCFETAEEKRIRKNLEVLKQIKV